MVAVDVVLGAAAAAADERRIEHFQLDLAKIPALDPLMCFS